MAKLNLDLGTSSEERYGEGALSVVGRDQPDKQYPSFHAYVDLDDLPREGEMTIRYKITRSVETEEEGKPERCEYTVEVREIVEADASVASPTKKNDTGDILDELARQLSSRREEANVDVDGEHEENA